MLHKYHHTISLFGGQESENFSEHFCELNKAIRDALEKFQLAEPDITVTVYPSGVKACELHFDKTGERCEKKCTDVRQCKYVDVPSDAKGYEMISVHPESLGT
jgi:hypothetical protein